MRIFKSRWFQRFAKKEGITDTALRDAADRADTGQIEADLGGEVIKQRISRPGQAKPGSEDRKATGRSSFSGGAPKRSLFMDSQKASGRTSMNINDDERKQYKEAAKRVLALTEKQLAELLKRGDFVEVKAK